jgi:glycosyltransferase involved in cell wall biosynthesis
MEHTLLITDVDFWAGGAGHRMRILHLLQFLVQHVKVTIAYAGPPPENLGLILAQLLKGTYEFILLGIAAAPQDNERLFTLFRGRRFESVIVEYIYNTFFLQFLDIHETLVILDAHDIISDRTDEFRKFNYQGSQFELSRELEFEVFDIYDYILVLCSPDCERINGTLATPKAILCSHPVPVRPHPIRDTVRNIAFAASEYQPNIDAIHFFVEECWPKLADIPDISLNIYGNICNKLNPPPANSRITLQGYIPDLTAIYNNADIIINPVRFGAGVKIKNIEALANGIPLVTTSHGSRGLEAAGENALLVADEAPAFSAALLRLIQDAGLRSSLASNACTYINEHFSVEKCYQPLLDLIT